MNTKYILYMSIFIISALYGVGRIAYDAGYSIGKSKAETDMIMKHVNDVLNRSKEN